MMIIINIDLFCVVCIYRVFKVGMQCIDEYKDQCLNQRHKIQMERAVAGAQHTFAFLCDDPVFQSGKLITKISLSYNSFLFVCQSV
jgi:hypothetical protein